MKRIVFIGVIFIVGVTIGYQFIKPKEKKLPFINPVDVNSEMVDSSLLRVGYGHKIGRFEFRNQNNKLVTDSDVKNKIYVAEYFFTTCKSICPIMNSQMKRVQEKFSNNADFKILSFTVDPETDTVAQMKRYAKEHGANDNQWYFLTGEKKALYELARQSFFVLKPAEAQNLGDAGSDFIHTNNFVLVDRKGRIRVYYDGTSQKEVSNLIRDINKLFQED